MFCLARLSSCLSWGANISVAWDPNSEPDLAGYRVYYAAAGHEMIDVGNQTNATLSGLQEGLTYTIYATAYNTAGLESEPSESITYTVPAAVIPPAITAHPLSQTVQAGQSVAFSVEATGTAPLTCQWFQNGAAIPGATSTTYAISAAAEADAGQYTVRVTNSAGGLMSASATLSVNSITAPWIAAQPRSQTVSQGQSAALAVQAAGTGPLAYQWFKDGSAIPGATGATFAIAAATAADAAHYHVRVTSPAGHAASATVLLSVNVPPVIQIQPASKTIKAGAPVTISVRATAMPPPSYQWFRNGTAIPGAAGSTYSLSSAAKTDEGVYTAVVSNIAGAITSTPARLTVNVPPVIAAQPQSQTVSLGQSAALSVQATSAEPLTYQWFKDGTAMPGATGASFAIAAATAADAAHYHVRITSPSGQVTSATALLSVNVPPVIHIQPVPQTISVGAPVTISVRATAMPPPSYQWFRNGTAIPGATGSTYSLSSAAETDAGDYRALVSNIAGEVTSATVKLEVIAPSRIASLPASSESVQSGEDIVPPSASLSLALAGETLRITGAASPGTTCLLQSCADLARGEWTTIQTVLIDATGQFQIELPRDPTQKLQIFRTLLTEP